MDRSGHLQTDERNETVTCLLVQSTASSTLTDGPLQTDERNHLFATSIDREPDCLNFLLLPRFAMLAFFSALEPLRVANRLAGRTLFRWRVFSLDGEAVTA